MAGVVVDQTLASTDLLVAWYAPAFTLSPTLTGAVFLALLSLRQHEVLWGERPAVVAGPTALRALLAPVVAAPVNR